MRTIEQGVSSINQLAALTPSPSYPPGHLTSLPKPTDRPTTHTATCIICPCNIGRRRLHLSCVCVRMQTQNCTVRTYCTVASAAQAGARHPSPILAVVGASSVRPGLPSKGSLTFMECPFKPRGWLAGWLVVQGTDKQTGRQAGRTDRQDKTRPDKTVTSNAEGETERMQNPHFLPRACHATKRPSVNSLLS